MTAAAKVVLLHGFTQTGRSWSAVADDLARDHEVATPDLPSHGSRADAPAHDLAAAADVVAETCGTATYAGYSLGGRLALQLALARPDQVERLVLVSTTAGIEDAAERAARRAADGRLADRLDPPEGSAGAIGLDPFLDEWLAGPLFAHLTAAQAGRAARLANTPRGLAASLRAQGTGAMGPLWHRLGELDMPVLLVAGGLDHKFVALAGRMATSVTGAAVEIVPGAGHAVPFERPEVFAALVRRFVAAT